MVAKPKTPVLGIGTAQWGMNYGIANKTGRPSRGEISEMLHRARGAGISFLDTARAYGESEATIGVLTGGDPYWRIVTKLSPDVFVEGMENSEALDRARQSVHQSLAALRRERLDVLLLHRADHRTALDGAMWDILLGLKGQGLIGQLGVSTGSPRDAFDALGDSTVEVIQVAASLLDQRLLRQGFFKEAAELSKEVHVRSIFVQGLSLLDPDRLPEHLLDAHDAILQIREFAEQRGLPLTGLLLQYVLTLRAGVVIVGCESVEQLVENISTARIATIPEGDLGEFAQQLPALEERLICPALWPR